MKRKFNKEGMDYSNPKTSSAVDLEKSTASEEFNESFYNDINNIPDVLSKVFLCLGFHDRLNCKLVCKAWFDILANYPEFKADRRLVINYSMFFPNQDFEKVLLASSTRFDTLVIEDFPNEVDLEAVFRKLGETVTSLELINSKVNVSKHLHLFKEVTTIRANWGINWLRHFTPVSWRWKIKFNTYFTFLKHFSGSTECGKLVNKFEVHHDCDEYYKEIWEGLNEVLDLQPPEKIFVLNETFEEFCAKTKNEVAAFLKQKFDSHWTDLPSVTKLIISTYPDPYSEEETCRRRYARWGHEGVYDHVRDQPVPFVAPTVHLDDALGLFPNLKVVRIEETKYERNWYNSYDRKLSKDPLKPEILKELADYNSKLDVKAFSESDENFLEASPENLAVQSKNIKRLILKMNDADDISTLDSFPEFYRLKILDSGGTIKFNPLLLLSKISQTCMNLEILKFKFKVEDENVPKMELNKLKSAWPQNCRIVVINDSLFGVDDVSSLENFEEELREIFEARPRLLIFHFGGIEIHRVNFYEPKDPYYRGEFKDLLRYELKKLGYPEEELQSEKDDSDCSEY